MATPTTVSSTPDATGGPKAIDGGMASPSTVSSTPPLGQHLKTPGWREEERPRMSTRGGVKKTANFAEDDDAGKGKKSFSPRPHEGDSNATGAKAAVWKIARQATNVLSGREKVVPDAPARNDRLNTTAQKPESKISTVIKKASAVVKHQTHRPSFGGPRQVQSIRPGKEALFAWCEGKDPKRHDPALNRMSMMARPYRGTLADERCSRCTREAVWIACDVFWTFDPTWFAWSTGLTNTTGPAGQLEHPKEITREGYIQALSFAPTVDRLRMLRRSGLEQRFRKSAQPVDLKEWLTMIWPAATRRDMHMMTRWAKLREAWSIVHTVQFRSTDNELNRIFDLLCESAEGEVPLGEFVRAQLIPYQECQKLFRKIDLHHRINKESDKSTLQSHFKTHVNAETQRRMKAEEEAMISNVGSWMGIVEKNKQS
mmetsp:Transcript_85987/g.161972  ORF Transcript_85987/g.161972 Transcript_85987/m.161972 type:complete len:428 (-) Transcript_85987:117-1400(-)